jgi:hypothetical protein
MTSSPTNPTAQILCEPEYTKEQAENLLPSERIDEAVRLACDAITNIRVNAIGQLADDLIVEGFKAGEVYGYIAERMTADGEPTHWRSVQHWRLTLRNYAHLLDKFPRLPRAAFALASEIAQETATNTEYILAWHDRDGMTELKPYTCEQVKAHFLPAPVGYSVDDLPGILSLVRSLRFWKLDTDSEIVAWLNTGRELIRRKLDK